MTKLASYKRLTNAKAAHADSLATLVLEFLGTQTLDTLFPPDDLHAFLRDVALAAAGSDMLERLTMEAVEREGHLRVDDGRAGGRTRREDDRDDRRDVSQSPPNSDQYGRQKRGRGRLIGRTKGGMNSKLHAICDSQGRPIDLFVTAGQVSD